MVVRGWRSREVAEVSVLVRGQNRKPCDGTVLHLDCGSGHMN